MIVEFRAPLPEYSQVKQTAIDAVVAAEQKIREAQTALWQAELDYHEAWKAYEATMKTITT